MGTKNLSTLEKTLLQTFRNLPDHELLKIIKNQILTTPSEEGRTLAEESFEITEFSKPRVSREKIKLKRPSRGKIYSTRQQGEKIMACLEEIIAQGNGVSFGELVEATGLSDTMVRYRLNLLRKEKRIRMEGDRRNARYYIADNKKMLKAVP